MDDTGAAAAPAELLPRHLSEGYETFLSGRFRDERQRFLELAEQGQRPKTMVIGCCDSRVAPEAIFDAGPGDLFVIRNVGNLVPPYAPDDRYHGTSAALEYAVMALKVQHIVVLGHALCGGVRAYAENRADPYTRPLSTGDFIGRWTELLAPAAERAGAAPEPLTSAYVERLALESIKQGLANLRGFPMVQTLEQRGYLRLHGAYFRVMDGRLLALDEDSGQYRQVAPGAHESAFADPRM
ncbi:MULTISPECIES: carbonic anhydrase [Methylosinus]|uniref:Carbonic anhydrase n=1 Tax=Methylosinus trichosporium (strain ATCC 35070 / NCIMB 11131 / UNIQEM 75 / OB3b) TaxID=595536 RepID=A0A2D2D106_METT3|nr:MULTISPECIES: carbonic anhydrase [Methylosinus]ATQ68670.1 carbonate dehydratase [Methylosinus trichosporium OB3b]OBS53166.1 carbonate dehydratase [Methylosinus sp. 3S-1]